MTSAVFEKKFVVFIDILGFAGMVSAASKDPEGSSAQKVQSALNIIKNMDLLEGDRVDQKPSIPGYHSHIFSDCIVISVKAEPFAVSKLFVELAKMTVSLMSNGVWLRGGMSLGLISRKKSTPWGPAIVEAYRVESQLAVNPRIALSRTALDFVKNQMAEKEKQGLIVRDEDGVWSLAPFNWALRDSYGGKAILTEIVATQIKSHLESAHQETVDNPGVFRKINWLTEQWDEHLRPKNGFPRFDCRTEQGKRKDSDE